MRLDPTAADQALGAVTAFQITAEVRNGSNEPIYDVIVTMPRTPDSDLEPGDIDMLIPGAEAEAWMLHRRHPGGGSEPLFGIPAVSFTDGRGQRWCRDHSGHVARDEHPVVPRFQRMKESGRRQDAWFATWTDNPFARSSYSRP
jgi:hypothetical protein